jgi:urea transport system substrate-binding protein
VAAATIVAVGLGTASIAGAKAAETIKVGVLHSLTGTMGISESVLKDTILMLIDEQNKKGRVLGRQLEAVVKDPASDWPMFGTMAEQMIADDGVSVIFGCWTSVSRKHVVPVVEEFDSLLFYPVQYEGQEQSENIFYTGATPNQQAIPAVEYLLDMGVTRFYLAGTDYVYPRTTNTILVNFLHSKGIADEDIIVNYTPFGHSDWNGIVAEIKAFGSDGKKTAVVSTVNGDANIHFYKELAAQNITADQIPVMAFSIDEGELKELDAGPLAGHLVAWNYFMSLESDHNTAFIEQWQAYTNDAMNVTNDPMEAHMIGFRMWVAAVEMAGSTDAADVSEALGGLTTQALSGQTVEMDAENHHLHKPVYVGSINPDGSITSIWNSGGLVAPNPWSPFMDG